MAPLGLLASEGKPEPGLLVVGRSGVPLTPKKAEGVVYRQRGSEVHLGVQSWWEPGTHLPSRRLREVGLRLLKNFLP